MPQVNEFSWMLNSVSLICFWFLAFILAFYSKMMMGKFYSQKFTMFKFFLFI